MNHTVKIIQREQVFKRFVFRIDELKLQHERYDGTMSAEITRLVLNRGDSVAMVLHDPKRNEILMCEQFRAPTIDKDQDGWWNCPPEWSRPAKIQRNALAARRSRK